MQFVDLFCGQGGASCGAKLAGMPVALAVDADCEALSVHQTNHPECRHVCAMLPCELVLPEGPLHIHASPPCQAVSKINQSNCNANAKSQSNENDALYLIRWAVQFCQTHATTWSLEQVGSPNVCALLQSMGVAYEVLNFKNLNVAQTRKRVIAGTTAIIEALRNQARACNAHLAICDVVKCRGSHVKNGTTTTYIQKDGVRKSVPLNKEHPSYARPISKPSFTVTGRSPLRWYTPGQPLSIFTPHELSLLQGFPSTYILHSQKIIARRYIGNALPPPVACCIVKEAMRVSQRGQPETKCIGICTGTE